MGWFRRKTKTGWSYFITFMYGDGDERRQMKEYAGTSKTECLELEKQRKREIRDGTYSPENKSGEVTGAGWAMTWMARRTNVTARDQKNHLRKYYIPYLGQKPLSEHRPKHIRNWIEDLKKLVRAGEISGKTVRNIYGTARTMYQDAVFDELIPANPCVLPKKTLPPKSRKEKPIYEKPDVIKLLTDTRIPLDRRVFYALAVLTGMRHGEAAGRRWKDWDPNPSPLGAIAVDTQYYDRPLKTSTDEPRPRRVPVHPVLAKILAEWKLSGFQQQFGGLPKPGDFIVPSRRGPDRCRTVRRSLTNLQERDCPKVGVTVLNFHRFRDTFISLARRDGARKDVLERVTHNASGEIIDCYTNFDWSPLCEAVGSLKLDLEGGKVIRLPSATNAGPTASP